jgi:hypothetical protein
MTMQIISLGAGVQSSTMALMAARGEIGPMPTAAIFADTGAEPKPVMQWLDWLETQLPFPVYRVMHKQGLRSQIMAAAKGGKFVSVPLYTETESGAEGRMRRQCTREYKLQPIHKKMRELLGLKPRQRAPVPAQITQWIGISLDEIGRMKPSRDAWLVSRHPLIELNMTRTDCLRWMEKNGYPTPPKSACTFCPYHDDGLWRDMKRDDPESFADAVAVDELVRTGIGKTVQRLYLHRSLKPLVEIDFRNAEDAGQVRLFDDECEGMCGV